MKWREFHKRGVVFSLLALVFVSMLMPFEALVDFQLRREYIGQNLCENLDLGITQCKGACYLEKKIEDDRQGPDSPTRFTKQDHKFNSHFLKSFLFQLDGLLFPVKTECLHRNNHYQFQLVSNIFHPPKQHMITIIHMLSIYS